MIHTEQPFRLSLHTLKRTLEGSIMNRKRRMRFEKLRQPIQPRHAEGAEVSCKGKISWWTLERAQKHAEELNERRIGDRPVRAYKCRIHDSKEPVWHVGRVSNKWKENSGTQNTGGSPQRTI